MPFNITPEFVSELLKQNAALTAQVSELTAKISDLTMQIKESFRLKVAGTKKGVRKWELLGEDSFFFR